MVASSEKLHCKVTEKLPQGVQRFGQMPNWCRKSVLVPRRGGFRRGLGNERVAGTLKPGCAKNLLNRYQSMFGDRRLSVEARFINGARVAPAHQPDSHGRGSWAGRRSNI